MTTPSSSAAPERHTARNGVIAAVIAFSMWGAFPIYFKVAEGVSALEMLAHRIVWSVPFGLLIVLVRRQWPEVRRIFAAPRTLALLALSASFITVNWLIYIYAVQTDRIFQASLGYYINPLMLMLVGIVFLGDRRRVVQFVAIGLAALGVTVLTVSGGEFPLIALTLAVSFTVYGVIRKQVPVGAMPGLLVETFVLFPFAAAYLFYLIRAGSSPFGWSDPGFALLLMFAGPLTVLPLVFFAVAARRLPLSTIGFLQFIVPTGQFVVALYYGETLTLPHVICFVLIWTALTIFVLDVWRAGRQFERESSQTAS